MTAVSARGLFRATGKASKPVAVLGGADLGGLYTKAQHLEREKDDFYPTPDEPTRALLHYEGAALSRFRTIWEPAAGDGAMSRLIEEAGHKVVESDLVDRGCGAVVRDFFSFEEPMAAAMITNPPYDEVNWRDGRGRWVSHAMGALGVEYMALLLSWSWPAAGGLADLWERHKPARAYLMRWKIDFTGQGAPPMLNGWFVWDKTHQGEPLLLMMDRVDDRQGDLLGRLR